MKKIILILSVSFLILSCSSTGSNTSMKEEPCADCGKRGDIELNVHSSQFYREWNPSAYQKWDSSGVIGVLPTQVIQALAPENCSFCHTFSSDALDFDLARVEDSLFAKAFPKMPRELMFPGARLPEEDSSWFVQMLTDFIKLPFVEGKPLKDSSPWLDRLGVEQSFQRVVSDSLKTILTSISLKYNVRYLSLPILLKVEILPKAGKKGGFSWKSVWTFWDARYGELAFLTYAEFVAETKTRVAPDRFWAEPFAPYLWRMLKTHPSEIENH